MHINMHAHVCLAHEILEMHVSSYVGSSVSQLVSLQDLDLTLDTGADGDSVHFTLSHFRYFYCMMAIRSSEDVNALQDAFKKCI